MSVLQTNHPSLTATERSAIEMFVRAVDRRFPEQVLSIQLFGSRARGDATPDSDMDLLVIMMNPNPEARRTIRDLAVDVWLTHGIYLSTRIWSEADRRQHAAMQSGFYRNLQQEAVQMLTPAVVAR